MAPCRVLRVAAEVLFLFIFLLPVPVYGGLIDE